MRRFAAILVSLTGCFVVPNFDNTQYLCDVEPTCPDGFTCQDGVCLRGPGEGPDQGQMPTLVTTPRSVLTLDRMEGLAERLEKFPLLVVLSGSRVDRTLMRADASDLRFYDSSGAMIPHEIEQVTSDQILAWVHVPRIEGTSTTVQVDYGRATTPPALPARQVWSSEYAAVFHFASDPPLDSTRYARNLVDTDTTALADGKIGGSRAFSNNSSIRVDAGDLALENFTISSWIRHASMTAPHTVVSRGEAFWIGNDVEGYYTVEGSGVRSRGGVPSSWTRVAVTADRAKTAVYIDTSLAGGRASTAASRNPIYLGSRGSTDFLDGALDEVRIETIVRSRAWIETDYLSVADALITYGPVSTD